MFLLKSLGSLQADGCRACFQDVLITDVQRDRGARREALKSNLTLEVGSFLTYLLVTEYGQHCIGA